MAINKKLVKDNIFTDNILQFSNSPEFNDSHTYEAKLAGAINGKSMSYRAHTGEWFPYCRVKPKTITKLEYRDPKHLVGRWLVHPNGAYHFVGSLLSDSTDIGYGNQIVGIDGEFTTVKELHGRGWLSCYKPSLAEAIPLAKKVDVEVSEDE